MTKVRILAVQGGAHAIAEVEKLVAEAGLQLADPEGQHEGSETDDAETDDAETDDVGEDEGDGTESAEALPELEASPEGEPADEIDAELPDGSATAPHGHAAAPSDDGSDDQVVLVVVLDPACDADPGFEKAMQTAASCGTRVIGIWPPGAEPTPPAAFEDYGADTVPWDPALLRDVVVPKVEAPRWLDPVGVSRPVPPTKRNRC